jgi:hypothetical protein
LNVFDEIGKRIFGISKNSISILPIFKPGEQTFMIDEMMTRFLDLCHKFRQQVWSDEFGLKYEDGLHSIDNKWLTIFPFDNSRHVIKDLLPRFFTMQ